MNDWPYGTQFLHQLDPELVRIKNTDRFTALDLARKNSALKAHENILVSNANQTISSTTGSSANPRAGQNGNPRNQGASASGEIDFDALEVHLEMDLEGLPQSKDLIPKLRRDLEEFYRGHKSRLQLWTGPANTGKKTVARKTVKTLSRTEYAGLFFNFSFIGYKQTANAATFFESFFDASAYPDNSIIFIEDADSLWDPNGSLVDAGTHRLLQKQLDHLKDERKIFFVFVGDFSQRSGPPLSATDREEIFGPALFQFVSIRYFKSPQVLEYAGSIMKSYLAQSIRLDDDALLMLTEYCVKNHINKDTFIVILNEIQNLHESPNQFPYTLEQVQRYLESR
jgi:Cdc6-like AAA superfamily ATPase